MRNPAGRPESPSWSGGQPDGPCQRCVQHYHIVALTRASPKDCERTDSSFVVARVAKMGCLYPHPSPDSIGCLLCRLGVFNHACQPSTEGSVPRLEGFFVNARIDDESFKDVHGDLAAPSVFPSCLPCLTNNPLKLLRFDTH